MLAMSGLNWILVASRIYLVLQRKEQTITVEKYGLSTTMHIMQLILINMNQY